MPVQPDYTVLNANTWCLHITQAIDSTSTETLGSYFEMTRFSPSQTAFNASSSSCFAAESAAKIVAAETCT